MDIEALTKRLRGATAGLCTEDPAYYMPRGISAKDALDAADALAALSADLSMAHAAAETARASSDHWEGRAKELERETARLQKERDYSVRWANKSVDSVKNECFPRMEAAEARATALAAEVERLREALKSVLGACDQGRMVERGVGGMTIEAQIRRSVINGVPAWPIEKARADLVDLQCKGGE